MQSLVRIGSNLWHFFQINMTLALAASLNLPFLRMILRKQQILWYCWQWMLKSCRCCSGIGDGEGEKLVSAEFKCKIEIICRKTLFLGVFVVDSFLTLSAKDYINLHQIYINHKEKVIYCDGICSVRSLFLSQHFC